MPSASATTFKFTTHTQPRGSSSSDNMTMDALYNPSAAGVFHKAIRPTVRRERLIGITAFVAGFLVCHLFLTSGSAIENTLFDKAAPQRAGLTSNPQHYVVPPYPYHPQMPYPPPYQTAPSSGVPQQVMQSAPVSTAQTLPAPVSAAASAPQSLPATSVRYCEDTSRNNGPCIFDIGHNSGQDTRNYLNDYANSRVVAIEANPTLVEASKVKFADAIASDRLRLVGIGITAIDPKKENQERPKLKFYVNRNDKFSSFVENLGCRNYTGEVTAPGDRTFCSVMELETRSCSDLVREYGTPVYFKIDIEGKDRACLESLEALPESERPKYTSIENVTELDIDILLRLGYTKFKAVNQNLLQEGTTDEEEGHSGPWGEDAEDAFTGKRWQTAGELKARLPLKRKMILNGTERTAWYDLHAAK